MSSEMRELINTIMRDCCESETSDPERDDTIMIREGTLREILERALLARTEAGADRPVAEISELSGAKLIVLYSADEIGHLPKGTKLYTHPHDASARDVVPVKVPAPRYIDCPCCSSQEDHLHQCMPYFAAMQAKEGDDA